MIEISTVLITCVLNNARLGTDVIKFSVDF